MGPMPEIILNLHPCLGSLLGRGEEIPFLPVEVHRPPVARDGEELNLTGTAALDRGYEEARPRLAQDEGVGCC